MGRNTTGLRPMATAAGLPNGETTMFFTFKSVVVGFWDFWCGLFAPIPFGDPYGAFVSLFVVIAVACKFFSGRGTTT
jgi:hypothetical protein